MKKPSIDELHNPNRFSLAESFKIDEMMAFLMKELGATKSSSSKPKTGNKVLRIVLIGMIGAVVGYFIGKQIGYYKIKIDPWQFLEAFGLLIFVLLPIHEGIHGLVFKILGADKVGFGWTPKTLMVYAYAQKFVMSLKENAIVAVMPFLVITLALLIAFFAVPEYKTLIVSTFVLHTYGCLGDFILINYYFKYRHKQMFTYDDIDEARMTYFFEKD